MALTYDGTERFGGLELWRFKDDSGEDVYVDDPVIAEANGAPMGGAPEQPGVLDDPFAIAAGSGSRASRYNESRPEVATDATATGGSGGRARRYNERKDAAAAATTAAPPAASPEPQRNLVPVGQQQRYAPARTIQVPGGWDPGTRQTRQSGPAPVYDADGNLVTDQAQVAQLVQQSGEDKLGAIQGQYALDVERTKLEQERLKASISAQEAQRSGYNLELQQREERDRRLQRRMSALNQEIADIKAAPIDENAHYRKMSAAKRILTVLGAGLAGFAAGMNNSTQNIMLDRLREMREFEIARQEREAQAGIDAAIAKRNEYAERIRSGRTPEVIKHELAALKIEEDIQAMEDNKVLMEQHGINAQAAISELRAEQAERLMKVQASTQQEIAESEKWRRPELVQIGGPPKPTELSVYDQATRSVLGEGTSKVAVQKANEELKALATLEANLLRARDFVENTSDYVELSIEQKAAAESTWAQLTPQISKGSGLGALDKGLRELTHEMAGRAATDVLANKRSSLARINSMLNGVQDAKRAVVTSVGILDATPAPMEQVRRPLRSDE